MADTTQALPFLTTPLFPQQRTENMPAPRPVHLTPQQQNQLQTIIRKGTSPQRLVTRAKIVLLASQGLPNTKIAAQLGLAPHTVGRWRNRYIQHGFQGIEKDKPRPGRKPALTPEEVQRIVNTTLYQDPPNQQTHWSSRLLGRQLGYHHSTIQRVWKAHGLKPHLLKTFKLSRDPQFIEKLVDVVGLYLNPPENAVVFSADEKSQCQALERSQQFRLDFDRPARRSHDYTRHGTTTLFAALCTLTGRLIHRTERRHTHVEWLRFLKQINREVEPGLEIHVICDNYGTHKHQRVTAWLDRHPRFHIHYTPTSASWLNLVERFFSDLTQKYLRRGSFKSVASLERTLRAACEAHTAQGTPYIWTATVDELLTKLHLSHPLPPGH